LSHKQRYVICIPDFMQWDIVMDNRDLFLEQITLAAPGRN
jgi:hypothetical protein